MLRKELLPDPEADSAAEKGSARMGALLKRLETISIRDLLRPGKGDSEHVE